MSTLGTFPENVPDDPADPTTNVLLNLKTDIPVYVYHIKEKGSTQLDFLMGIHHVKLWLLPLIHRKLTTVTAVVNISTDGFNLVLSGTSATANLFLNPQQLHSYKNKLHQVSHFAPKCQACTILQSVTDHQV